MVKRSKLVEDLIGENRKLLNKEMIFELADMVIEKNEGFLTGGGNRRIQGVGNFLERMMNKMGVSEDFTLAECDIYLSPSKGAPIRGVFLLIWKKSELEVLEEIENLIKTVNVMKG